jgi:Tol biopolymer transport system component
MKKLPVLLLTLGFITSSVFSQKDLSPAETFQDAEFFFTGGEYEEALYLFSRLAEKFPENQNIQFRVGMSYLNIPGRETESIPHLEKAVENTTLKYKEKDFSIRSAPHHAWFYLGNAYRINNELDKALESYETFMDIRNFEKKYNLRIVENEIQACQRAKIIKDSPVRMQKTLLSPSINSSVQNFQPVVNPDETVMVYMQKLKFYDAIMFSIKEGGSWSNPINITPQVGSDGDLIPTGISPDGRELLMVKSNAFGNKDIYLSKLEGDFWSKAEKLPLNTIRSEDHASFSTQGDKILFSSDRRGGFGKLDLWVSERSGENNWSAPANLGPVINTEEDETSGFFVLEDQHIYFSSKAHFNMGGYDIFFSEKEGNKWTDPLNIGYPVNTTGDNRFYQPTGDGAVAYLSLFNQDKNINEEDIYRIQTESLAKIEIPERTLSNRNFSIEIKDPETGETIILFYNKEKDDFEIKSSKNREYNLSIIDD